MGDWGRCPARRAPVSSGWLAVGVGLATLCAALWTGGACRGGHAPSRPAGVDIPKQTERPSPTRRLPELVLHPSGGEPVALRVEIAASPARRQRGLMYRKTLPRDRGMLFVFPRDGDYPFYMKNTYLPLDLIYIDARGRIVGFLQDLRPLDETSRSVGRPARYVLEVNAHSVRNWGLAVGDRLSLPPLP